MWFSLVTSQTSIEEREQPQAEEKEGGEGEKRSGNDEQVDSPTKVTSSEVDEQVLINIVLHFSIPSLSLPLFRLMSSSVIIPTMSRLRLLPRRRSREN